MAINLKALISDGELFMRSGEDAVGYDISAAAAAAGIGFDDAELSALNGTDLQEVLAQIDAALGESVSSEDINDIVLLTRAEYDLLDPPDESTFYIISSGGGGGTLGGIVSIVAGSGIAVDNTDPSNPIISATGGGGGGAVDSVNGETGAVVLTPPDLALDDMAPDFGGNQLVYLSTDMLSVLDVPPEVVEGWYVVPSEALAMWGLMGVVGIQAGDGIEVASDPEFGTAVQTVSSPLAESALQPGDIGSTVQAHDAVLDATTASFTTADESLLGSALQPGADADDITADPTGHTILTGETVQGQLDEADAALGGLAPVPLRAPGLYYGAPEQTGVSFSAMSSQPLPQTWFFPEVVEGGRSIDRLAIQVVDAGGAGNLARLGVYGSDNEGRPGALLGDAGTVPLTSTGWKELVTSIPLGPVGRRIWFAVSVIEGVSPWPFLRFVRGTTSHIGNTSVSMSQGAGMALIGAEASAGFPDPAVYWAVGDPVAPFVAWRMA